MADAVRPLRHRIGAVVRPVRSRLPWGAKTAFILSGGGSLGAVQVGMLRALVEADIRPDLILGCSVGSINGAGFAADPSLRGVARLERIWRRLAQGDPDLMPSGRIPLAVQLARKGVSLHDPQPLEDMLSEELPVKRFEDLSVPFQCVATDVETASEYWFDAGPLVPALMASASLPAVYPPRDVDGREYIDGGVLHEIHTAQAAALGASQLYVLHVGHLDERPIEVQRPFDGAVRAYWTHRRFRLEDDLNRVPASCTVHRLPAGVPPRLRFDDFSRAAELAESAYTQSSQYLRTGLMPDDPEPPPEADGQGEEPTP